MRIFCQKIHEFVPLDSKSMFHHYLLYQNTYLRGPLHTLSMFPARHGDVHSSPSGGMDCPQHPAANARCSLSWNLMESIVISPYPIGSMYGIYANIGDILMGSMLPYILGQSGNLCRGHLFVPQTVCRWEVHDIHVILAGWINCLWHWFF